MPLKYAWLPATLKFQLLHVHVHGCLIVLSTYQATCEQSIMIIKPNVIIALSSLGVLGYLILNHFLTSRTYLCIEDIVNLPIGKVSDRIYFKINMTEIRVISDLCLCYFMLAFANFLARYLLHRAAIVVLHAIDKGIAITLSKTSIYDCRYHVLPICGYAVVIS